MSYADKLEDIAKEGADIFVQDMKDLVKERDNERLKDLVKECYDIKIDALKNPEEAELLAELLDTKLGTLAHVLDSERIVVSREVAASVCRALKSMLNGFAVVGKELIKVSVRVVAGGLAGGILGSAGEKLADKALDVVDNLVDKTVESASEKLSSE